MGLFQMAYLTYDRFEERAGLLSAGEKEPLPPVSHTIRNAQIEITISQDGSFVSACKVPKEDEPTIIPATIDSAARSGSYAPHPLSEQLIHIWNTEQPDCKAYIAQLQSWAESEECHEKAKSVLSYVKGNTLFADLNESGVLSDSGDEIQAEKILDGPVGKWLIRWRVMSPSESACWKDLTLFDSFIRYYNKQIEDNEKRFCQVSGEETVCTGVHPKGTVKISAKAKLISANDTHGFTFRGRFSDKKQAGSVGYLASQKVHNVLRWLIANHGFSVDSRVFLFWSPQGGNVPEAKPIVCGFMPWLKDEKYTEESYRSQLHDVLLGYRQKLRPDDKIIMAAFDAATAGRLSVVSYTEQTACDFLNHTEDWFETCCWPLYGSLVSPSIDKIARAAFGIERGERLVVDERLKKNLVQRLIGCVVQGHSVPKDIVRAVSTRASQLQRYSNLMNREVVLSTACAIIRKSRFETKGEKWSAILDERIRDRSYLFGRLLATAEKMEKDFCDAEKRRETNAILLQNTFYRRPLYAWQIIEKHLISNYEEAEQQNPMLLSYYKELIDSIWKKMPTDDSNLNHALDNVYLIGYYNQRSAFYKKSELAKAGKTITEE